MTFTREEVDAGQAVYTRRNLALYDWVVHGMSNRFCWECPAHRLEAHYNRYVSANHLDVGVGTGYFLDRCHFPSPSPRVALMDLNPGTLEFTSQRISRYRPERYVRNVLEPVEMDAPKFDSIGINYLLHCLPGTIETKGAVFDHMKSLMNPGAVLFGSTLLQSGVRRNGLARRLMNLYNKKGIFSNRQDDLDGLTLALNQRFGSVSVELIGCAALFSARVCL